MGERAAEKKRGLERQRQRLGEKQRREKQTEEKLCWREVEMSKKRRKEKIREGKRKEVEIEVERRDEKQTDKKMGEE